MKPFHIASDEWPDLLGDGDAMREHISYGSATRAILAFADPFTTPMHHLLPAMDRVAPTARGSAAR